MNTLYPPPLQKIAKLTVGPHLLLAPLLKQLYLGSKHKHLFVIQYLLDKYTPCHPMRLLMSHCYTKYKPHLILTKPPEEGVISIPFYRSVFAFLFKKERMGGEE